ncbi:MAG: ornithine carbamoyltransferase [Candidatus Micrarchaeota archaeon]
MEHKGKRTGGSAGPDRKRFTDVKLSEGGIMDKQKPADFDKRVSMSKRVLDERTGKKRGKPERSFLTIEDLTGSDMREILDGGIAVKKHPEKFRKALEGKSVALLFQKTSTRTRVSFEIGVGELGGQPMYVDWRTSNFTLANLEDEIKVLSRYVDLIMARVYKNTDLQIMRKYSEVPIINGLCDLYHPCQGLADYMTMQEYFGKLDGLKIAYLGDGNNVCNSIINGAVKMGMHITVAHPEGYAPLEKSVDAAKAKGLIELTQSPEDAVQGADVVYTDTWVSMGDEEKKEERLKAFKDFAVTKELLEKAPEHALVMHCLPAHRGYEITEDVIESRRSIVFDEAENRKHVQKYLMMKIMEAV